jgi:hypothetical protein
MGSERENHMWRKIVIALATGIMFLSCARNVDSVKAGAANKETPDNQASNVQVYQTEEEIARDAIYVYDDTIYPDDSSEILSLYKINGGAPGGDNWLVDWKTGSNRYTHMMLYVLHDNIALKHYDLGLNFKMQTYSSYDIMQDIPGTHIGNGCSSMGDFNGDGLDEVFRYGFGGNGNFIVIIGYDTATDDIEYYCSIPFQIIDSENGPAPVEFMTYKRMVGFKVYYFELTVAGGPTLPPDPASPNNRKWFFYTWDAERREYVQVEEFDPTFIVE